MNTWVLVKRSMNPIDIVIINRKIFKIFLKGIKIGLVGISSWSFKKAIILPVKVIVPIMTLKIIVLPE